MKHQSKLMAQSWHLMYPARHRAASNMQKTVGFPARVERAAKARSAPSLLEDH